MEKPLISSKLLEKSNKILFFTHLAIGDFTYLQNCFAAFHKRYPHIKIDLWVDEVRRTWKFWKWKHIKKYVFHDWLDSCSFFNKIYKKNYTPFLFRNSIKQARKENYNIVISFAQVRQYDYAEYARKASPNGYVVGITKPFRFFQLSRLYKYRKLDEKLIINMKKDYENCHISDVYADWFYKLFGLKISKTERIPYISIPKKWEKNGENFFLQRNIEPDKNIRLEKVIFFNSLAKDKKRSWPLEKLIKTIKLLISDERFYNINFIINSVPEKYEEFKSAIENNFLKKVYLFSAMENFFQLPAILSFCDLVVSVETSVPHLSSALNIPVISLMRKKNPEWVPYGSNEKNIIFVDNRNDWIKEIKVQDVAKLIKKVYLVSNFNKVNNINLKEKIL